MSTLTTNNSLTQSISGSDPTSSRVQQKSVNFSPEFSDRASHNKKRGEQKMNNIKIRRKSRIANESNDTSPVATRTRRRASCNEINVRRRKASVIEPKCAPSKRNEKFENDINSSSSNMKEDNPNKRQSRIRKTQISLSTLPLAKKAAASKSKSIANEKDELFCNKNAKKVTFFLQTDAADDTILAQRPSHSKCQKNQQEKQRQSTVNIGSQTHNDGAFTSIRQQLSFLKSEQFDFLYNNCKVRCVADIMNLTLNQLHAMGICEPQLSQLTQISFEMKTSNENVNVNNNDAMNICKNRNKSKLIKVDENLVHSNNAYDDDSDSQTLLIDQNKCEPFDRGNASMKNFDKLSPGTAAASLTPADALRIRYEAAKHTDQIVERIKQNLQKLKTTNIDPKGKEEQLLEMFNELKLHEEQLLRRQQEMNIMELGETSCSSKKNLKKAETEAARSSVNISLGDLEPTGSFEKTDHNVTAMQEERLLKRQHQMIISEGRELPGNSKMNLLQDVCNEVQVEPEFVYASVDGSGEDLEEIIQQSKGQKEQQIDIKEPGGEGGGWSGKSKTNVLQNVCSEIQSGLEVVRQSAHGRSENSKESMRTERKNSDSEVQELNENFLLKNTQAELSSEVFAKVFTGEGSKELTAAVVKHNNNKSPPCETITSSTDIVGEASNSKKLDNKSTKMTEEPLVTTTIENEIPISRRIKLPKEEDIQKKQQRLERNDDNECAINSNINNEIVSENAYAITTTMMNSSDEGKQKYKDESEVQTPSNRFRKTLRIKLNRAKILRKKRNCREDNKSGNQSVSEFALSSDKQCLPSTSLQGNSNIGNALPAAGEQVSSTEFSKINITKKPRSNFGQISDIKPIPRRSHGEKFVKEDEQISSVKCPKLDVIEKQLPNFEKTSIIDSSSSRMVDNLNVEDVVKEDPMLSPKHNNNFIDKQSLSKDDQENTIDSSKLRITEKKISKLTRTKRLVSAPITAPYDKTIILRKTKPSNTITTSFKRNESKGLTLCTAKPSTSGKLYEKVTTSDSKSGKLMITHEPVVDETAAAAAAAGAHNNGNKERDLLETSLKCLPKPTVKDCRKRNNSLSLDELREQENELVRSSEKLETPTKNAISLKEEPSCSNFNKRGRITYDDNDRSRIENRSERSEIAIDLRELLNNKKYKASMRQLTMEATNSIDGDNERRLASPTSDQQRHEGAICQQIDSGNRQNRCTKQMMNETKIKTVEALPVNVEQQTNDNDFATKPESCDGGNSKVNAITEESIILMTDEDHHNHKYRKHSELCNELTQFTAISEINIENKPIVNIMPIALPTPMDDTIASPSPPRLDEPKNYYHFNQNDGRLKSSSIEYKLHEIDIPKITVNKPNNFDKLVKTYSLDPRIFRSPIISNQQPVSTNLAFPSDPRSRLPVTNNFSITHDLYGQQQRYQYQQQHPQQQQQLQQNPNMLLYGYLQRSPWYQNLMSAMKIQINQSISQLVRALNNFYRERVLYPHLVFDIFKIDCAGTLIEIMQNLGIYVDAYGVINEQRPGCDTLTRFYFNPVAPVNPAYGFIQEILPSPSSCTEPGVRHNSLPDSLKDTQPSSSQAYKYSERCQPSSSRHDDANHTNRNRSHSRSDRHFDSNQHSIKSECRRGHKRSSLSPSDLPDHSKGTKDSIDFVATSRSSLSTSRSPSPRSYKSHKSSRTSGGHSSSNYSRKSSQVKPQQAIADDEEEESWD